MCPNYLAQGYQGLHVKQAKQKKNVNISIFINNQLGFTKVYEQSTEFSISYFLFQKVVIGSDQLRT